MKRKIGVESILSIADRSEIPKTDGMDVKIEESIFSSFRKRMLTMLYKTCCA